MDLDFLPYNEPSYKEKIIFPNENKSYSKDYYNKKYYFDKNLEELSLNDLKELAKELKINSEGKKSDLINSIKSIIV